MNLRITRAAVYQDGRLAARILYSGRLVTVKDLRAKALGRLLPAGFLERLPDDGSDLYDLWTAKHPQVHVPSDSIVAHSVTLAEAVALIMEGALSGAAR